MSDDNVINLHEETTLDIPPNRVLESAPGENLKNVLVLGFTNDDDVYFASSTGDAKEILYLLEIAKMSLLGGD